MPQIFLARTRRRALRWTAGLAITALAGTTLVVAGAPAASAYIRTSLPSEVFATAEALPDGAITRVELTGKLIALEVAVDGLPSQVWTLDRSTAEAAWHQIDGMEALQDAEGGTVRGTMTNGAHVVLRASDGAYRAIPSSYQLDPSGTRVSFRAGTSVTIQDAISGTVVASVPLGSAATNYTGHRLSGSLITAVDGYNLRYISVPTGAVRMTTRTGCGDPEWDPAAPGKSAGYDGRFALVMCWEGLYSIHDSAGVYYSKSVDKDFGSFTWSLSDGMLIGVSTSSPGDPARPLVFNPWTNVVAKVPGAPASLATFDTDGNAAVFASNGELHSVDLTPVTSEVLDSPPDSAAPWPVLDLATWSATRTYTVRFKAFDDDQPGDEFMASGVARIEARHRSRPRGAENFGAWSSPIVVGSSRDATASAGSRTCWQTRATDKAGNLSAWTPEQCVQIDGTAPSVTSRSLPSSTKVTGTTTDVTFRWYGSDNGRIGNYTIRRRATPRGQSTGEWTYENVGTATSFTRSWYRSRTVCFQVKASDKAGNVSDWSKTRCTYVDGIKPKVSSASVKRWMGTWPDWKSGLVQWYPTFRYSGTDDKSVYRYQREVRGTREGADLGTPSRSDWLTSTSTKFVLNPVDQECARVRIKDRAGNVSDWSRWKCSNAPADWRFGMDWGLATYARDLGLPVSYGDALMVTGYHSSGPTQTERSFHVNAVRLNMVTGPTMGSVHVYVGDTRLGTVNSHRATWGMRNITLESSRELTGRVRLVAASGMTATSHLYVIR
ncbi:hypothetical protein [Myceligenerans crystallogenes]|uniref:Fibronectin type-III domain-containing protein n=1 Tax=Myceligenerans crystallogenes TaxID=316335 RepID=A0ABP4ZTR7_9MICO